MSRLMAPALLTALAAVALAGCSDDTTNQLACPAAGIGVKAATGESCGAALASNEKSPAALDCLDQFANYRQYDCADPQICIDKTKKVLYVDENNLAAPIAVTWTITNCSAGKRNLTISGLGIAGDKDCFFAKNPEVENRVIEPGKEISMQLTFKPVGLGEHHAAIYLISDAQNYPKMIMPICVLVRPKAAVPDGGVRPDAGTSLPAFDCKDVTRECNETCHPGCSNLIK